jgi:Domain of unknown function (DUF397)
VDPRVRNPTAPLSGQWFKSSFSGNGDCCVEVKVLADQILVRDSKFHRDLSNRGPGPVLSYTPDEWPGSGPASSRSDHGGRLAATQRRAPGSSPTSNPGALVHQLEKEPEAMNLSVVRAHNHRRGG